MLIATLCIFTLAACQPPQTPQPAATALAPEAPEPALAQAGTAHRQSPFVVPPAGTAAAVAGADNYKDLLKRYPEATRVRITAWFDDHAAGSMAFTSNAQWQWMRQHDYPTPDDVLKASTMTDAKLRDLAMQGDTKANFFYLARLLDDVDQAGGLSTMSSDKQVRVQANLTWSMDRALASGSAFAGYMFGNYYAALHGKAAAGVGIAAGLNWAGSFGDSNSLFHSQSMLMGFPGVSGVRVAEVSFDMFAAAARVNPYFKNQYRSLGELFIR